MDDIPKRESEIRRLRGLLRYRRHLVEDGVSDRVLQAEIRSGALIRVSQGCFMRQAVWAGLHAEERLLARTIAVAHMNRGREQVFSHHSAAAIWGLPLYRASDERVHVLTPCASRGRSNRSVVRHSGEYAEGEVREIGGLRLTDLTRTVADLARLPDAELAVGCADAGLRMLFGPSYEGDSAAVAAWRGTQLERLERLRGRPGVRAARRVVLFADPRADSVVESVSRLQFARLGMDVDIQVRVRGLGGVIHRVDFEFLGQRMFGEVDGAVKYRSPEMLRGRTPEQAVLDEKEREDQVRGLTQYGFVRWTPRHCATARRLGERMLSFGLRVPTLE